MTEIAPDRRPHHIRTAWILGILGLIPFVACAFAIWALKTPENLPDRNYQVLGFVYGIIILNFLGGIRWGLAISPIYPGKRSVDLALSVLPSIYAFGVFGICFLFIDTNVGSVDKLGLTLLAGGFGFMLLWDLISHKKGHFPSWFMTLRVVLSLGAIISLLVLIGPPIQ